MTDKIHNKIEWDDISSEDQKTEHFKDLLAFEGIKLLAKEYDYNLATFAIKTHMAHSLLKSLAASFLGLCWNWKALDENDYKLLKSCQRQCALFYPALTLQGNVNVEEN